MKKVILLIALFCPAAARSQTAPSPRYSFALAFDEARGKLVMFGGSNRGEFMNDTWEWDGEKWEMKSQEGPSARNSPAMTYDSKRKTVVLFGGDAGNWNNKKFFNDTWEWNGTSWKLLASEGPPARTNHTVKYDRHRSRVVLFGGMVDQKTLGDLWEWDGTTWTQSTATGGPGPRFLHASEYDEAGKRLLIFGGNSVVGPPTSESIKGDLWTWNGAKWELCEGSGPSPRDHVDMVFDRASNKMIVHGGGMADGNSASDTWQWDGNVWSVRVKKATAPLEGYKLIYDSKHKTVLLFGGFEGNAPSSSIWRLNGSEWSLVK